jgi:hypothetical protein
MRITPYRTAMVRAVTDAHRTLGIASQVDRQVTCVSGEYSWFNYVCGADKSTAYGVTKILFYNHPNTNFINIGREYTKIAHGKETG